MTALFQAGLVLFLQTTVLLSLGLFALRFTRPRGPAVQTLVGRAALSGAALLLLLAPLSGRITPVWRLPFSASALQSAPLLRGPTLGSRNDAEARRAAPLVSPAPSALPASPEPPSVAAAPLFTPPTGAGPAVQAGAANRAPTPAPAAVPNPSLRKDPATEAQGSKAVGLPSFVLLAWLAVCQWHLTRLRRTAQTVADGPAAALLASLTPHPPALLTHPAVHSPFLAGLRRPAIFLPPSFAADFDADALRAVFTHELAHRDRRDNLWTLAARLLTAFLWFQPLLWLLGRRLEQISEDACDEAVLAANCPPRAYAASLLSLAERPQLNPRQRTLTVGVAPFRSSLGRRVQRILTLGVPIMPAVTLRLRLSITALTVAAALGGAFLISSAPAKTQAKPTDTQANMSAEERRRKMLSDQEETNLKAISLALVKYEAAHHYQRFPAADHWMDQISPYLSNQAALYAPSLTASKRYGYAFNRNCSDKPLGAVIHPLMTVLIFPSIMGTKNAADNGQSLRFLSLNIRNNQPDTRGSYYAFTDGHVKWFRQGILPSFSLKGDNPAATRLSLSDHPYPELDQSQLLAGSTSVQGPGVVVTLTDSKKPFPQKMPAGMTPPNLIHDIDINQVVNELKSGGAEAISINGQRLVATSAVRMAGPLIFINNRPATAPYTIKAIGDPKALIGVLSQTGGIASQIKAYDKAMFSVQQAATLTLPAYTGGSEPRYARPTTEGASQNRQERLNVLLEQRAALQANYDKGNQAFLQYERSFDAALRQALPQGSAQTFAKARNLEFGIGWNVADLAALRLEEKQHPETRRDPALTAERQSLTARLAQMRDEEAGLFPKDAEAQQHLAQVHALALHHPARPLRLQVGAVEIELLDDEIQHLR